MAERERIADGYEVIQSVNIQEMEIVVAQNPEAEKPYLTWRRSLGRDFGEESFILPVYNHDYLKAMREFTRQINIGLDTLGLENVYYHGSHDMVSALTEKDCVADGMNEDLEGKVIAIRADALLPEYRSVYHQLFLATGGFGCAPDARGRAVFGTDLRTGEQTRWNRADVLGVVPDGAIPGWARKTLAALQKNKEKESEMNAKEIDGPVVLDRKNKKLVPVPKSAEQESVLEKLRQSKQQPSAQRRPKIINHDKGGQEL